MKNKPLSKRSNILPEEMRSEYRFDYKKSKPNRFAAGMASGTIAVVLEHDVASVLRSSKSVNSLLRSVIKAMPSSKRTKAS